MLDAKLTDDSLLKIYKVSCVSPYIALSPSPSIYYSDKSKISIKIIERFDLSRIRTVLGTVCLESRGLEFNYRVTSMFVCTTNNVFSSKVSLGLPVLVLGQQKTNILT